jgi:uncharacterized protein YaaW (UPF0174 family)
MIYTNMARYIKQIA